MDNNEHKGEYLGKCNITACATGKSALYYNYGTSKYYCEDCAKRLNEDPFNKADAMRLFGHDLCIEESKRPRTIDKILEEDKSIPFTNPYPIKRNHSHPDMLNKTNISYVKDKLSQQNNDLCNCDSGKKFKKCCKKHL